MEDLWGLFVAKKHCMQLIYAIDFNLFRNGKNYRPALRITVKNCVIKG